MKPPKDRQLAKPGRPDEVDPKAAQLAHDDVVQLLTEGLGRGIFHNGVLVVTEGMITGTPRRVYHGLGRVPTIAFAALKTSNTGDFVTQDTEDPRNYITLNVTSGVATTLTWLIA